MKKILCMLAALCIVFSASADEGMWLLPLLQKMNAKVMKSEGCKLSPDEIYSINHSSLKDAIVQFGGGCTGEMISGEGLLVTNHHCGYGSIQKLSTPEHNYLENGYWAMNRNEEIPVPGLKVTFLKSMTDVTPQVAEFKEKAKTDTTADMKAFFDQIMAPVKDANPNCSVDVVSFYNNNVYYIIVYKVYTDVRFVGAPPVSVGKFGGETDNWMWPRHTGDFSMFRVYAGKDNEPAAYSKDNVPLQPAQHLKISLNGVKENDFSMIMGFPGRTQRFQTADQLNQMMDLHDISIAVRGLRQSIMWDAMESDPTIRLKYANKYAGSANGYKKWIGEKKAFSDLGIISSELQKEAEYTKWINENPERVQKYGSAIGDIKAAVNEGNESYKAVTLLSEVVSGIEIANAYSTFSRGFVSSLRSGKDTTAALQAGMDALGRFYQDYYAPLDKKETAALLKYYRDNALPQDYLGFQQDFKTMDIDAFVNDLFSNSVFASEDKLKAAVTKGDASFLKTDKAFELSKAVQVVIPKRLDKYFKEANDLIPASEAYTAGLLEWKKGQSSYPDANSTMRLTYGTVKPYSPKDALTYRYYTTLDGVMEKEDSTNYEFIVPAKLKELYNAKDYGQYAMSNGQLPVCFLTNNDITGGNSGSPVMNAKGELIGLAFDGNWESMSSDVMFEPDLQRCICVDIRYVLFLVDKLGGAGYLVNEMDIAKK
jgi:hypothetical protein